MAAARPHRGLNHSATGTGHDPHQRVAAPVLTSSAPPAVPGRPLMEAWSLDEAGRMDGRGQGVGVPWERPADHRQPDVGALPGLADVSEPELLSLLRGGAPRPSLLRRLAPALRLHTADLFVIAGAEVPGALSLRTPGPESGRPASSVTPSLCRRRSVPSGAISRRPCRAGSARSLFPACRSTSGVFRPPGLC
ncbi:hypothetical protein SY2F82_41870 [Streptomyces sp. Y2F8-2]|nr:hypothetical protein SY2F82_41870 [Streptomyces sp. Y2F8-2]